MESPEGISVHHIHAVVIEVILCSLRERTGAEHIIDGNRNFHLWVGLL